MLQGDGTSQKNDRPGAAAGDKCIRNQGAHSSTIQTPVQEKAREGRLKVFL